MMNYAGGRVAEWSARRTRNPAVPGSSRPALATCWICSSATLLNSLSLVYNQVTRRPILADKTTQFSSQNLYMKSSLIPSGTKRSCFVHRPTSSLRFPVMLPIHVDLFAPRNFGPFIVFNFSKDDRNTQEKLEAMGR